MKKTLSILLSALLVFTTVVPITFAETLDFPEAYGNLDITDVTEADVVIPTLDPGQVWAGKDVNYEGDGIFEISLLAGGRNFTVTTPVPQEQYDIVLVLDRSGSMGDGSKLSDMKTAAKGAVDAFLGVAGNRVAIVSYAGYSSTDIGLTDASGIQDIKDAIDDLDADDGTNIQNALLRTENLLKARSDQQRKSIVILMSDGEPTYYHTSLTNHSGTRVGDGVPPATNEDVWYTILQAQQLKDEIDNLNIYTIGFGVGGNAKAEATLMPTDSNASSLIPNNLKTIYSKSATETAEYRQRRTRNLFFGWSSWDLITPLEVINDELSAFEPLKFDSVGTSVPSDSWSSPTLNGVYSDVTKYFLTQYRYAQGSRTLTRYEGVPITFNHQYWSQGSSLISDDIDDLISAFTDIVNDVTNVKPHELSEANDLSDVVITDVVGSDFNILNVGTPSVGSVSVTDNTITWTIPGEDLYTVFADVNANPVDSTLLNKLTFEVEVKEAVGEDLPTNTSASASFTVDSTKNPKYNSNEQAIDIPGTGLITLVNAQGSIVENHVFVDDSSRDTTETHTGTIDSSIEFEPVSHAGYTYEITQGLDQMIFSREEQVVTFTYTPIPVYTLTVQVEGSGTVSPSVGDHDYQDGTVVPLTATPAQGYQFDGWSVDIDDENLESSVTMDADKTVKATFSEIPPEIFTLTVQVEGSGTVSPSVGDHNYEDGTVVPLTATPAQGYQFDGWSVDIDDENLESSVTMDADKTVKATFSEIPPENFTLTVQVEGSGTVSPSVGDHNYEDGTVVPLTATPDEGYQFDGWSVDIDDENLESSVTMDADKTVKATFSEIPPEIFTLTVQVEGSGTVSPSVGDHNYEDGTVVPLTATPAQGYQFDGWSVDIDDENLESSVTMDADKTVKATFSEIPPENFTLTVQVEGSGTVSPSVGDHNYEDGTVVPLTAIPDQGYQFDGWSVDIDDENMESSVTMDADKTVKATFSEIPPELYTLYVNHELSTGGEFAESEETTGFEKEDPYSTTPADFNSSEFTVTVPGNASGTFGTEDVVVTYIYTPIIPEEPDTYTLTVNHELSTGGNFAPPVVVTGFETGDSYTTTAALYDVNVYTVTIPENESGVFGSSDITVDYLYTPIIPEPTDPEPTDPQPTVPPTSPPETNPPTSPPVQLPQGTVTVSYEDTDGNDLASSFSFSGDVGSNYITTSLSFDGYELVSTPGNASGSFIDGNINVTYVYSDGEELPTEPVPLGPAVPPTEPETTEPETTEPETTVPETTEPEEILFDEEVPLGDALPQTGQFPLDIFYGIGAALTLVGVSMKKKK